MDPEHAELQAAPAPSSLYRLFAELGLVSLYQSPLDAKLLCVQRFVRYFAYGCSSLVLISYLKSLGFSGDRIGLFMTLTLWGDVAISFLLTSVADNVGRKAVLGVGALMMAGSGVTFALSGNYWILLAAAILGVISPSGNEIGPFRAVEESTIAWLTTKDQRSDVYAWYTLLGALGTAIGSIASGWIFDALVNYVEWDHVQAYRGIFLLYAALGGIKLLLVLVLSRKCEVDRSDQNDESSETRPLLAHSNETVQPKKGVSLWPSISRDSIPTVLKLLFLFGIDTFASGLVALTWVVNFYKTRFSLPESTLGNIFFVTGLIAAGSMLVASSIAKRFGNIKTMVFTHLPSAVFLALIPLPDSLQYSLTFLVLRSCSQSMDTAPRAAFTAAVLKPRERTAILGILNIGRTISSTIPPLIAGFLDDRHKFWIAFVVAGSLKVSYDLGMLFVFITAEADSERKNTEEQEEAEAAEDEVEEHD